MLMIDKGVILRWEKDATARVLIWQLLKALRTIQKQGKFLLLTAAETLRCTQCCLQQWWRSLWLTKLLWLLWWKWIWQPEVSQVTSSAAHLPGEPLALCSDSPPCSHPLAIAVLLQPLITETSSCHLQWSEINTTGLTICFRLKLWCFLACFLAMHAVLPGCKVQLWTACCWTQVLSAQDCIAEPTGNCFQCQVFHSSQIWCSDIILSLCFSKGTKVSTYGIDKGDLSINVFCSHTEGQRWQLSSYGYFCWRKPLSFQRCCYRHFQAWYLLLSSVSIHHLPQCLKGACSHSVGVVLTFQLCYRVRWMLQVVSLMVIAEQVLFPVFSWQAAQSKQLAVCRCLYCTHFPMYKNNTLLSGTNSPWVSSSGTLASNVQDLQFQNYHVCPALVYFHTSWC